MLAPRRAHRATCYDFVPCVPKTACAGDNTCSPCAPETYKAGVNALAGGRSDFACTKLSGCFGPLIAEHVFAHVLRVERRVDESWRTGRRKGDS